MTVEIRSFFIKVNTMAMKSNHGVWRLLKASKQKSNWVCQATQDKILQKIITHYTTNQNHSLSPIQKKSKRRINWSEIKRRQTKTSVSGLKNTTEALSGGVTTQQQSTHQVGITSPLEELMASSTPTAQLVRSVPLRFRSQIALCHENTIYSFLFLLFHN